MSEENTNLDSVNEDLNGDVIETTDEDKKSLVDKNGDLEQDKNTVENGLDTADIVVESGETEEWYPDGGWGWMVVVGAVIIHVYVGKTHSSIFVLNFPYILSIYSKSQCGN